MVRAPDSVSAACRVRSLCLRRAIRDIEGGDRSRNLVVVGLRPSGCVALRKYDEHLLRHIMVGAETQCQAMLTHQRFDDSQRVKSPVCDGVRIAEVPKCWCPYAQFALLLVMCG